ncbi:histidine kinase [Vitiosangium sp. GDMCC 1.1324]|nr:histidine kinase [Vitiosangium sp. GDMCC 1.1324]
MGVRIAGVVALATLFSYLHLLHTVRTEDLERLERHVGERSQREQLLFVLAQDNHAALKKALEERLRAMGQEDVSARFDGLVTRMPDGTLRSRVEGFDGTKMPGIIVNRNRTVDAALRRRILAAYDVVAWFGPALHTRFTNTYVVLPEEVIIVYWPERPNWCHDLGNTIAFRGGDTHTPENNPTRRSIWSGIYADQVTQKWMVSVSTPLDMDGQYIARIGHDVLLEELMARTISDHLPGTYNMIFRDDGSVIAHPELTREGATGVYDILGDAPQDGVTGEQRHHLRSIFERVRTRAPDDGVVELPEFDEYLGVARLEGPGWNFVTVLPERVVSEPALRAARQVLLLGTLALFLELVIMSWVLRQQITRPLLSFTQAADRVAAGDFQVELDTSREDELGQLARAIRLMADKVQHREEALRHANESLEHRVEERTHELQDVHRQLVQTARRAGMAEIATNVLHNVGNVLTSVHTSAQLAKERMSRMRLEQVSRVADMLEQNLSNLSAFLTRDERGQHVTPFLGKLGQSLQEERQELLSLLDDVSRYTEHIGDIVKVQQTYARTPRLHEAVHLEELVEDSLRINSAGLLRHRVKVERNLAPLPPVLTDKHKVLMILVNLVSNARNALDTVPEDARRLSLRMECTSAQHIRIEVRDNGVGIAPELLTRIFQYGFTTRDDGHGFGLHSSALAAQELGGSIEVHSEGPGQGASFTLVLPYLQGEEAA